MEFKFAQYTDVTAVAFEVNPQYKANNYVRVFLCPDTDNVWLSRILSDTNADYEYCKGSYIVEREKIDNDDKHQNLTHRRALKILRNDEFNNWDYTSHTSLDDAIKVVDGGYSILGLTENK